MKKISFLFCALMVMLSVNAAPVALQAGKLSKNHFEKMQISKENVAQKAVGGKFIPGQAIKRAPAAKMETYDVTIVDCAGTNRGTDIYYIMNDADGMYIFAFDIFIPSTQEDVTLGQTYTLADMDSDFTGGVSLATQGQFAYFTAATFVKTMDPVTGLVNVTASATDADGNVYNIVYQEQPMPDAQDTNFSDNMIRYHINESQPNTVEVIGLSGSISSLVIPDSVMYNGVYYTVTTIGSDAFISCTSLTSVTIPESVTTIGYEAFNGCTGLTSVTIPESVTTIGYEAFNGCTGLTSVTWNAINCSTPSDYYNRPFCYCSNISSFVFGNQVQKIPDYLCYELSNLSSVTLPESVTTIGSGAFSSCASLTSVTIPESVTTIGNEAFEGCTGLTSVTIPESVTTIGNGAFSSCTSLTSVNIPESVTTIGEMAFYQCSGLTSVTWNAVNCSTHISSSSDRPFNGCSNISSFVFGNQVQKIPDYLCYELTQISSITIPNTVNYIGQSAFEDCNAFNSLIVPENVDTIGRNAFEGCNNLSLVIWNARNCVSGYWYKHWDSYYDDYIYEWENSSNSPFPSSVGTFIFGDHVQQVPNGLCRELNQLTSIALPNTVTKIGEYAFSYCSGLISVTMEEGVQTIGDYAFQRCTNLPQIVIPNSVTKIGDDAFGRCSNLTTATIGNHVDTIGSDAFISCERLMSIELPTSVSYIGESAFHGCLSMNKAIVHSTAELDPLCMILLNPQIDTIVAPASIFDIDEYYRLNFVVTKRMKYVRATTGELTEDAFAVIRRSASTLETLDMAGTTNTSLADEAFSNMYRLRTLALPSGVTEISYKAAAECVNLTQVTIPASVETIGQRAFENCRSLQAVIFSGNNLQTIGNWAFYNNHALRQITIPAGVTTIGAGAFYGCTYLEELAMPASLLNVGDNAFALCNHLTKMQVEATLPPQVAARTFFDVNRAIPVYVPDEAVNDYRTTQVWQEFFIRPISQAATGIGEVEQDGQEGTGMLPDGKFMQNGQLFIRKNGRVYDTQGRLIE